MGDEKNFSIVSLDDIAGFSAPLKKLVKVVADGMGRAYKPMAIFLEGKAEAARIRTLARAHADAEREFDKLQRERQIADLDIVPDLRKRAELRLMAEAAIEQENLERIAAKSTKYIGESVSDEDVNPDWRTLFFKNARDISDETMREVWAQVLAGEVTNPGTFSLRTLETLRVMSRAEAELFQRLCGLVFEHNYVVDVPLERFGVSFNDILALRGAGILFETTVSKYFPPRDSGIQAGRSLVVTHDIGIQLIFQRPAEVQVYMLTKVGQELRRLVTSRPNNDYVAAAETIFRNAGMQVSRIPIRWDGDYILAAGQRLHREKL